MWVARKEEKREITHQATTIIDYAMGTRPSENTVLEPTNAEHIMATSTAVQCTDSLLLTWWRRLMG